MFTFSDRSYPKTRLRRLRQKDFSRRMVKENQLSPDDLIYPVFICEGSNIQDPVASMPGVFRYSLDQLLPVAEACLELGIPAIALFPFINAKLKTGDGKEALNEKGPIPTFVKALKHRFPELGIVTDIALDPYTSHGQDGLMDENGSILNDQTIDILVAQALLHAESGVDIVAPSDMMDGRIGVIRTSLEEHGFTHTLILSYAAKYASGFYGPFRDAVGSGKQLGKADKKTYQMDPGNSREAFHETMLDLQEGADMVMVKPGLPYLDIVHQIKTYFGVPTLVYQVSGEYAMIKAAAQQGWINHDVVMMETLLSMKRAGADAIFTYHALEAARLLKKNI
jgi:porphobilinogen synthase